MSVGQRLKELAAAAGYDHLSEFAEVAGVKPGTAQQQANRERIPADTAGKYIDAARGTGATLDWLLTGKGTPPRAVSRPAIPPPHMQPNVGPAAQQPPEDGVPDLEVWASAEGGREGAWVVNNEPIDHIRRPQSLLKVRNAFAVHCIGDSMDPAYAHGDTCYIDPGKPVGPGDDCLFIREDDDGGTPEMYALLKRLVRYTATTWHVRQFSPKKDFELSRAVWRKAYLVTGKENKR